VKGKNLTCWYVMVFSLALLVVDRLDGPMHFAGIRSSRRLCPKKNI
jgi:hypothetical protein